MPEYRLALFTRLSVRSVLGNRGSICPYGHELLVSEVQVAMFGGIMVGVERVSPPGKREEGGKAAMPTYVALMNWTDQGARTVKDTVHRREQADALAEKHGAKIEQVCARRCRGSSKGWAEPMSTPGLGLLKPQPFFLPLFTKLPTRSILGYSAYLSARALLPCSDQKSPSVASSRDDQHPDSRSDEVHSDSPSPKEERDGTQDQDSEAPIAKRCRVSSGGLAPHPVHER